MLHDKLSELWDKALNIINNSQSFDIYHLIFPNPFLDLLDKFLKLFEDYIELWNIGILDIKIDLDSYKHLLLSQDLGLIIYCLKYLVIF